MYGLQDFPITGMGMNTFRRLIYVLYPPYAAGPETDFAHAHNEFLQAGLDLGLPGLVAYIGLYLGAFAMLVQSWRMLRPQVVRAFVRACLIGLGAGLWAHCVYGFTDAIALGARPGFLFWVLLGLITGLFLKIQREDGIWA
jgi:putative inorganic carbon (HCO3(-)) transporter